MDQKAIAKHILRLTEILLNLLHQEKQFIDCCHSLEEIDKQVDSLWLEVRQILTIYKSHISKKSSVESIEPDIDVLIRQTSKEESISDKLSLALTTTLNGTFNLFELYDSMENITESSESKNSSSESSSLLSIKQEATIRLSIGIAFKLTFRSLLKSNFVHADKLLPISDSNGNINSINNVVNTDKADSSNRNLETNIQLCAYLYKVFLAYGLKPCSPSNARLQASMLKDCFATLIACRVIFMTRPEVKTMLGDVNEKLNRFSTVADNQQAILRELLVLTHCGPNQKIAALINRFLMQTFKQPNGIETLVESVLDSDPASEHLTTITTRMSSIASILVLLPVVNKNEYYTNLINQSLFLLQMDKITAKDRMLKHSPTVFWRISSQVLQQIHAIDSSVVEKQVFKMIFNILDGQIVENLSSIDSGIEILHRILTFTVDFPIDCFYSFFRPLLFVRFAIESSRTSPLKSVLNQLLIILLKNIPDSVFLIDETINLKLESWLDKYESVLDPVELCPRIVIKKKRKSSILIREENSDNLESLENLENFSKLLLSLISEMPKDFAFDLFFLLLEHIIGDRKNILSLLLLSSLGEMIEKNSDENDDKHSEERELLSSVKRIKFLSNTLERITSKIFDLNDKENNKQSREDESSSDEFGLFVETLKICISILEVIVEKLATLPLNPRVQAAQKVPEVSKTSQQKLNVDGSLLENVESIQRELRICEESLKRFLVNKNVAKVLQPLERMQAENVLQELSKVIDQFRDGDKSEVKESDKKRQSSTLKKALSNLREPLMPVRAHGLIVIRQLIQAKDPSIDEQFELILESVRNLLVDSESYLYLAAINALGALAVNHTDQVLQLLLNELIGVANSNDSGNSKDTDGENSNHTRMLDINDRHKIGEVLMQLAKSIGDFAYHYSNQFIGKLLIGVNNPDPTIRISCLVLLGKYCRNFRFGLSSHIVELVFMGERMLQNNECLEVRRAAADFFRQLLEGIDKENVFLIQDYVKPVKDALLMATSNCLDDVLQLHCQLAFEELNRIAGELLTVDSPAKFGFREIK